MFEFAGQCRASESASEWLALTRRSDGDVVVMEPEADLVTRLDAKLVAQLLGDHDLALGADTMSHTYKYNLLPGLSAMASLEPLRHKGFDLLGGDFSA